MIEAESRQGLAGSEARDLLDELRGKLEADSGLKLNLSWKLYREKSKK